MKTIEDMFNGCQSVPTDHQMDPPLDGVHDHQMAPTSDAPTPPEEVHNVIHDDIVHDPFSNIVLTPQNDTWVYSEANLSLGYVSHV